jgi:hypothetical protein
VAALRFFFRITLKRSDIIEHTAFIHEPHKLPLALSPEEVARLLEAAPGLKYKYSCTCLTSVPPNARSSQCRSMCNLYSMTTNQKAYDGSS